MWYANTPAAHTTVSFGTTANWRNTWIDTDRATSWVIRDTR